MMLLTGNECKGERSRLRHEGGRARMPRGRDGRKGPVAVTGPFLTLEQAARIARTSSFWKKAVLLLNYTCVPGKVSGSRLDRRIGCAGRSRGRQIVCRFSKIVARADRLLVEECSHLR